MINSNFIISTRIKDFKDINPVEVLYNTQGAIALRELNENNDPLYWNLVCLAPDMIDDMIKALRSMKAQYYPNIAARKEVGNE